ncbi:Uncharacterised protein [Candidatus Ornithobacterium hominis]|uniref:hypothetical protein n=1 Tax=Candidatus Ornithobacterium hominis TaxID=2497989 RepID=UPI000E5AF63A|nr:hypothetical protein [Candidatus Ornithobacterium hominis]SZD73665.1 Uncharacterised protein [Candidatus Ornithobacterium hominis]
MIEDYYEAKTQPAQTAAGKVVDSILQDLMMKLERKLISKRGEGKEFSMTLKYHEAYSLASIAHAQMRFASGEFERNVYRLLTQQIERQL